MNTSNRTTSGGSVGTDFRDDLERRIAADPSLAADYRAARQRAGLGLRIARLRHERGLSQAELAGRVNTSQSVISRYEAADYDNYSLETLRRLADALGADLRIELLEKAEIPT